MYDTNSGNIKIGFSYFLNKYLLRKIGINRYLKINNGEIHESNI